MGAWGGWALAPNTASMGRDCHSHIYSVAEGPPYVQTGSDFFLLFGKGFQSAFRAFLERFQASAGVRKSRQIKNLELRF
jgi:hypothetical protein